MGNDFFRFKQFTVYHNHCAMKVGIDGVLLGAWADISKVSSALDIGAGSGLISLMLAQRCNASIDAIDIDKGAVIQTSFNFQNSPWSNRLSIHEISLQNFSESCPQKYDLLVSNPPFFVNSLKNQDENRTNARHASSLNHEELLICAIKLLNKTGRICLILPVAEGYKLIEFSKTLGLFCNKLVMVYPKPDTLPKRLLIEFSLVEKCIQITELTIESQTRHQYSNEFTELVRDFYLKL